MIAAADAGDGNGLDVGRIGAKGTQVFDGEDVVGLRERVQDVLRRVHVGQGVVACARIRFAHGEVPVERAAKGGRFVHQHVAETIELLHIRLFTAESEVRDDATAQQCADAPECKAFGARNGVDTGQLQHQIRAALDSPRRARILVHARDFTALDEIAGQDDNAIVRAALCLGAFQMIDMSIVQRIVFRNDADNSHPDPSQQNQYTIFFVYVV